MGSKMNLASISILCVLLVILLPETIYAESIQRLSLQKRQSDQVLAHYETLRGLQKLNMKFTTTVPVGYGLVNPAEVGRK